ncbi:MAG: hypothetical protein ACM3SU_17705 [Acidobacteriota bacterium]
MSSRRKALVVAMVALVLLPALLSACPLCKDALDDKTGAPNQLGIGFYYSILLMVAAPFLAIGVVFFQIYRARRPVRSGESEAAESASLPAPQPLPDPRGARS